MRLLNINYINKDIVNHVDDDHINAIYAKYFLEDYNNRYYFVERFCWIVLLMFKATTAKSFFQYQSGERDD